MRDPTAQRGGSGSAGSYRALSGSVGPGSPEGAEAGQPGAMTGPAGHGSPISRNDLSARAKGRELGVEPHPSSRSRMLAHLDRRQRLLESLGQGVLSKSHEETEEVPAAPKPGHYGNSNDNTLNSAADSTQQQDDTTTSACYHNPILQLEDSFQQLSRVGSIQRLVCGPGNDGSRPASQYRILNVQNAELHLGEEAGTPYDGVTSSIVESRRKDNRL